MKVIAMILLALTLNGCAVYLVKCDCPKTLPVEQGIRINKPYEWRNIPNDTTWHSPIFVPDSVWYYPGYHEINTDANIWEEDIK